MKGVAKTIGTIIGLFLLAAAAADAQTVLQEDFNDENLAPGFELDETNGYFFPNVSDEETWTVAADVAWDWTWPNHSVITPPFTATYFTVHLSMLNFLHQENSEWDNVKVTIRGLEQDLSVYVGSSAANGELNPNYALYAEIQHPDKANGYIWDSRMNRGGQPVPPPWSDFVNEFPDTVELRIVFNGPEQPLDVYYNFNNQGWRHLLPWDAAEPSHTFENVLANAGEYQVGVGPMAGSLPPFELDLDHFAVEGDIESEFATGVADWQLH